MRQPCPAGFGANMGAKIRIEKTHSHCVLLLICVCVRVGPFFWLAVVQLALDHGSHTTELLSFLLVFVYIVPVCVCVCGLVVRLYLIIKFNNHTNTEKVD